MSGNVKTIDCTKHGLQDIVPFIPRAEMYLCKKCAEGLQLVVKQTTWTAPNQAEEKEKRKSEKRVAKARNKAKKKVR